MSLERKVIKEGDGKTFPKAGQRVKVHYTGTFPKGGPKGGEKFDSSKDRGKPFEFVLGRGQVIAGWDEGVAQMSVGEVCTLHVPSGKAYGASGAGGVIPPHQDLDFEVELLGIGDEDDSSCVVA